MSKEKNMMFNIEDTSEYKDGYCVGYSGKADNQNRFIPGNVHHDRWQAGYKDGIADRKIEDHEGE